MLVLPGAHGAAMPAAPRTALHINVCRGRSPLHDADQGTRAAAWNKEGKTLLFLKKKKQKDFLPFASRNTPAA